jgi:hypothetical protein
MSHPGLLAPTEHILAAEVPLLGLTVAQTLVTAGIGLAVFAVGKRVFNTLAGNR